MKKYEGLFIFPATTKDEELDSAIATCTAEIAALGGTFEAAEKLGRRQFARPMNKQTSGVYVKLPLELDADKITPLLARYKLNDRIFRVQIRARDLRFEEALAKDKANRKAYADARAAAEAAAEAAPEAAPEA